MEVFYFPCDEKYKNPVGGVKVNQEFRVFLATNRGEDAFLVVTKEAQGEHTVYYDMNKCEGGYEYSMHVTSSGLYFYHFEVVVDGKRELVFSDENLHATLGGNQEWQLTAFDDIYNAPSFLENGIFYQIMVDRFAVGGERKKTKRNMTYRADWGGLPTYKADEKGIVRNGDMFGGNLDGVREKLDYLASLGVKCIYLNPIFEASSNHKYDTADYTKIDSDFGDEISLKNLVKDADARGIKVILDGVFSHTGSDSVYFNKEGSFDSVGAYQSKQSPYYWWYDFKSFPDEYDCWWGVKILPCVKEDNPNYNEFINGSGGVIEKWMDTGIAGWRLDVADELPDIFLDNLTRAVKGKNPDALVLGEVWEDASNKISYGCRRRYFQGAQLDSVTNYPFKDGIVRLITQGDVGALSRTVHQIINNYPPKVVDNLMNTLSTHDTMRIITTLSGEELPDSKDERANFTLKDYESAKARLKVGAILQYTLPGVPCLYYGDEAGMQGCEDPFNRRCYPWNSEDNELIEFYRALGKLRLESELNGGKFKQTGTYPFVFEFTRGENLVIVANVGEKDYKLENKVTDLVTGKDVDSVSAMSAIVYRRKG